MIELDETNFTTEVIDKSYSLPVLVDFWADWCAPCKMLAPVLDQLAADYQGQLHIAKVNTDEQRGLAEQNAIRSLPTLRLYRNGEAVEEVLGAQPESVLRQLIDAYLVRPSDNRLKEALTLAAGGQTDEAIAVIEQAIQEDPGNARLAVELARLCIKGNQPGRATELINGLPREIRDGEDGTRLRTLLDFAETAANSDDIDSLTAAVMADPKDSQRRHQLAARHIIAGDYDAALVDLMELLKHDRSFGDGAAQRGLLAVFSLIEDGDQRVAQYRRKMASLLL